MIFLKNKFEIGKQFCFKLENRYFLSLIIKVFEGFSKLLRLILIINMVRLEGEKIT